MRVPCGRAERSSRRLRGIRSLPESQGFRHAYGARTVFEVNGLPSVELSYHHPSVYRSAFEVRLDRTERRLLSRVDAVLTQSQATERFLRLRGLAPGKARVIPNGAHPVPG